MCERREEQIKYSSVFIAVLCGRWR